VSLKEGSVIYEYLNGKKTLYACTETLHKNLNVKGINP